MSLLLPGSVGVASAQSVPYPDIFPLSKVKTGMKGYGLTTFKGTNPSRFEVTVIGILRKENNGHDLILVRMKGGPLTQRGAHVVQGMSGSPVYLNGKVAGAVSGGEEFNKEPIVTVTPMEDMLDAWDPKIPQQPSYFPTLFTKPTRAAERGAKIGRVQKSTLQPQVVALQKPLQINGRQVRRFVFATSPDDTRRSTTETAVVKPATTLLAVTGITEPERATLQKELNEKGYALTVLRGMGGGRDPQLKKGNLRPGSPMGAYFATGDIEIGGMGTVTYRRGNRILGFGHPMMRLGAVDLAITAASVVDVSSLLNISHFNWVAGPVVGSMTQDRDYSIAGEIDRIPHFIPFEITVRDHTNHRTKTFRSQLFQHPDWTPTLMRTLAQRAVLQLHNIPGDVMARITTTVEAAEMGSVTRSNLVFASEEVRSTITQDLNEIASIASGNPYYPLPIKSAKMAVEIMNGHETASVERIFLKQGKYEPGDTMEIGVVLKPWRRPAITRTLSLKIPANTPPGRYPLIVRGGAPTVTRIGPFVISGGQSDPVTPPVNVQQMVARFKEQPYSTDLLARLTLNTLAPAVEGERLSQLPPNISALMRSERNSAVRLERDELKTLTSTDYVLSGNQALLVTISRKTTQETSSVGSSAGSNFSSSGGFARSLEAEERVSVGATGENNRLPLNTAPLEIHPETRRWMASMGSVPFVESEQATPAKSATPAVPATPGQPPTGVVTTSVPAVPDLSNEKPVGRQLQVWKQTARSDFAAGKFAGTSITSTGELHITPTLRRMTTTGETYLWSLVADAQNNLYAGTGTSGAVLKITPQGESRVFAKLPALSAQTLLLGGDGTLYVGCSTPGSLYKIAPVGTVTRIATLTEKIITALSLDSRGNLFIGTGNNGTIYRIEAGKSTPTVYLKTNADYVLAMTTDAKDNLYIGTGNEGVLHKVTPEGKDSVLFDAKENQVTALTVDEKGNLYAGTGPKGLLYRFAPDGTPTLLYDKASSFFTSLKAASNGVVYASTVNSVYRVLSGYYFQSGSEPDKDPTVQPLENPKDVDFLSLAVLSDGSVAAGTGNVGEVYTAPAMEKTNNATFESVVHDAKLVSRWGTARWNASKTKMSVETRTGNVAEPDSTWSAWEAVRSEPDSNEGRVVSPEARFIQYRLTLDASHTARRWPLVRDIAFTYLPRNQAPKVTLQSPVGGERWSKSQTVRWNATDPDNDTLTYEVHYSDDGGLHWKPLPTGKTETKTATEATPTGMIRRLSLEEYERRLDSTGMSAAMKRMYLDQYRQQGSGTSGSGSTRETSRTLDTALLPDGTYILRVVASDHASNPTEALNGQVFSEPFVVCNTLPQIRLASKPQPGPDRRFILEGSVQQKMVAITAIQYRIDKGDWVAATPKDGLFDGLREEFALLTETLKSGKHILEVLAFNAAGGKSIEQMTLDVP